MIAAALGGDSLTELRQAFLRADAEISGGAFARVAPFIPLADAGGLLQRAGFALPVTDLETYPVRYADALKLMRELKGLGAQNPLADRPDRLATRRLVGGAAAAYAEIAGDPDGRGARHARNRLAAGLGAARIPAEAAAPRQRNGQPEGCTGQGRLVDRGPRHLGLGARRDVSVKGGERTACCCDRNEDADPHQGGNQSILDRSGAVFVGNKIADTGEQDLHRHPSEQIAERCDQRFVGRWHRVVAEGLRTNPFEAGMFAGHWRSLPLAADVKWSNT